MSGDVLSVLHDKFEVVLLARDRNPSAVFKVGQRRVPAIFRVQEVGDALLEIVERRLLLKSKQSAHLPVRVVRREVVVVLPVLLCRSL